MTIPCTEPAIRDVLARYLDPETGTPVTKTGQLGRIDVLDQRVRVELGLSSWCAPVHSVLREECNELLREALGNEVQVEVAVVPFARPAEKLGQIGLPSKSVIAVGSGKGGVGKSTVAASIAYGLRDSGARVGLMDADVYGPSVPHLLGVNERPQAIEKRLQPIVTHDGLRVMSMGFLVPAEEAIVWRGPMLHGAITQFLRDTDWGELDYLVIDMPPGTGDIALTLSQLLPLSGAVVVCTPQDVALLDAVKAIAMFRKVNIPLLGLVENMSYFCCPDNGKRYNIFGHGGAQRKAVELNVPFLGEVPIQIGIRERGDAGDTGANTRDQESAPYFQSIVQTMVLGMIRHRRLNRPKPTLPVL